ncbi:MAG: hypothetical protein Unbinned200contig1002_18 [Prokaryotic dsDNA virus sp.]|jgi:hypothetical protein|nr:hypothetical protein [Flavobacteriaceae bacterium]QDP68317.1 MAG: hypothetical protein Unbinned200contig1002_18 [Prokaryotic dsDNA virus sp.]|tara:strand:- start:7829 stop:8167 length:339 start_codon:yes stop_codon:yes gene_type:complete
MGNLISSILNGLDDLFTSDEERLKAEAKLTEILTKHDTSSQRINEADAKGNWFQSSWRPLLAYICVFSFIYNLVQPLFGLPKHDLTSATEMLYYLLGYASLRSFEKIKGVVK